MAEETNQSPNNNVLSLIPGGQGGDKGLEHLRKLITFEAKYGTYRPEVGDIIRSLPNVYTGKISTGRYGVVIAVYERVERSDYRQTIDLIASTSVDIDVGFLDDDGEILCFSCNSAFFELIARKGE